MKYKYATGRDSVDERKKERKKVKLRCKVARSGEMVSEN
jgi:hypothetical protein